MDSNWDSPTETDNVSNPKCVVKRRSHRLRSIAWRQRNQDKQDVEEPLDLSDSERECESLDGPSHPPEEVAERATIDAKVTYLLQTVKYLMSQQAAQSNVPPPEQKYKLMYFTSHMKNEALTAENSSLREQLHVALAEIQANEAPTTGNSNLQKELDAALAKEEANVALNSDLRKQLDAALAKVEANEALNSDLRKELDAALAKVEAFKAANHAYTNVLERYTERIEEPISSKGTEDLTAPLSQSSPCKRSAHEEMAEEGATPSELESAGRRKRGRPRKKMST